MLLRERQEQLIRLVNEYGVLSVEELSDKLNVSKATIRRDINELDQTGKIEKVFGGATALSKGINTIEYDMNFKSNSCIDEKDAIARYSATLIQSTDIIFIDSGSTTLKVLSYVPKGCPATFVTNGIEHARTLVDLGFNSILIGGRLKARTEAVVGTESIRQLDKFNFTKCFLGTNGISLTAGLTTPDSEEAAVKEKVLSKSYISYILADHTKFNMVDAISFGSIEKSVIITDICHDKRYLDKTIIKEVLRKED